MKSCDVIVVGGGLAGSAAAIELQRNGQHVCLLEKEISAHHKVCGEFISYEAADYLKNLGLDLDALGAQRIDKVRLVRGSESVCVRLPFQAFSLSRLILDEELLKLAVAEGVDVSRGRPVTQIYQERDFWYATGSEDEVRAKSLFLATGKHDMKGWSRDEGVQNDMIGFKIHYRLRPEQTRELSGHVEIILLNDGYAGLEPVEHGLANLCLVVKKSGFASCGKNWEAYLKNALAQSSHFARRLEGSVSDWHRPLAIYGIPYGFVFKDWPNSPAGLYRIGDQMAVIPSFSGDGMSIALHSAKRAVSAYLNKNSQNYHERMAKELTPQIRLATLLMVLTSWPIAQKILFIICKIRPNLLPLLATKTRIKAKEKKSDRYGQ